MEEGRCILMDDGRGKMEEALMSEGRRKKEEFYPLTLSSVFNFLHRVTSIFTNSSASLYILWNCLSSKYPFLCSKSIQYNDSLASLSAIKDLLLKSALLMALHASALFAPIEVPALNS